MGEVGAESRRRALVSDLASSSGVKEEDVSRVLDQLGLSDGLERIDRLITAPAVESIAIDDIRVSVRAGGVTVAV
ncbi:MAG TPA: hypothetical protein VHR18_09900 [Solirubrobacterales bacterium]|jgi:hypothetical protein|nr:hypothetical protein [Solirubrobacterales bacterium]